MIARLRAFRVMGRSGQHKERHAGLEERLDSLVLDLELAFPGCIGLGAAIEVSGFQIDEERLYAAPFPVFLEDDDQDDADAPPGH